MNAPFDPYHKWLGIAPKDQPPNHYRLLGIDAFETDADVISLAADQRMAHIRTFQTGQNAAISQKMLNELAAARICLLSPATKNTYDRGLKLVDNHSDRGAELPPTPALQRGAEEREPAYVLENLADDFGSSRSKSRSLASAKRKNSSLLKPVIFTASVFGIVGLALWLMNSNPEPLTNASSKTALPASSTADVSPIRPNGRPSRPTAGNAPRPIRSVDPVIVDDGVPAPKKQTGNSSAKPAKPELVPESSEPPVASDTNDRPDGTGTALDNNVSPKTPPSSTATEDDLASESSPAISHKIALALADRLIGLEPVRKYPSTPPNRKPIPDAAAHEQARKLIRELFKSDIKSAKTVEAKVALAEKLKAMALETKSEPATQFVLFEEAAGISVHPGVTSQCIDDLADRFDVDAFELQAAQLERIAKEGPPSNAAGVADCCLNIARESTIVDRLDVTPRFLAAARVCANRVKDRKLGGQISEQSKEVERLRKAWEHFHAAVSKLQVSPDDPDANLAVGRYLALSKAEWDRALPFLAMAPESTLGAAAMRELADPVDAIELFNLANGWWDAAAKEKAVNRLQVSSHAAELYGRAAPGLSGIQKLQAEQRIEEVRRQPSRNGNDRSIQSFIVEAHIDGFSELHLTPSGIYWKNLSSAKPGCVGRDEPTYVDDQPWMPVWSQPQTRTGEDVSDQLRLVLGRHSFDSQLLLVSKQRGGAAAEGQGKVSIRDERGGQVVLFSDSAPGSAWYKARIFRKSP